MKITRRARVGDERWDTCYDLLRRGKIFASVYVTDGVLSFSTCCGQQIMVRAGERHDTKSVKRVLESFI